MTRLPPRPRKVKRLFALTKLWEKLCPGVPVPTLPYKPRFMSQERADTLFLAFRVRLVQIAQFKEDFLNGPIFAGWLFFGLLTYYLTLRDTYQDQIWTYGLRRELPRIAHQIQEQDFTTLQYVTAPTAVERARQLGTKFSESAESASPLIQFLETPFLKRLDMYPTVALFELTPQWASLRGDNYITTRVTGKRRRLASRSRVTNKRFTRKFSLRKRNAIPVTRTFSTINSFEYKPLSHVDPLFKDRLQYDLADEVPTRLDDAFGLKAGLTPIHSDRQIRPFRFPIGFFNRDTKVVTGPRSGPTVTANSSLLAFQKTPDSARRRALLFGIPTAEVSSPQNHLPESMVEYLPQEQSRASKLAGLLGFSGPARKVDFDIPLAPAAVPSKNLRPFHALDRRALIALDKGLSDKMVQPSFDVFFDRLDHREREQASTLYAHARYAHMLGFSPSHPLHQKSWFFDLAGLTPEEARMRKPDPLPEPPKAPFGYEDYRGARRPHFPKRTESGPLVSATRAGVFPTQPATTRAFVKALKSYRDELVIYRKQKLAFQAAERDFARVEQKAQDLRHFWDEQLPQALLDHIKKLPPAKPTRPTKGGLFAKAKSKPLFGDWSRGQLDWFAHLPVTQYDWYQLTRDLKVRLEPEDEPFTRIPLTIEDTRALIRRLFMSNFTQPRHLQVGHLKARFVHLLGRVVEKNELDAIERRGLRDFYRRLRRFGLSSGPMVTMRGRLWPRRGSYKSVPAAWRIAQRTGTPSSQHNILNDRRFYPPIIDWMDKTFTKNISSYVMPLPKGVEFHWALHAHDLAVRSQTTQDFIDAIAPQLEKINPRYRDLIDPVRGGRGAEQRAEQLRDAVYEQTSAYLRAVEYCDLRNTTRDSGPGWDFLDRLVAVTNLRRLSNDLARLIREQGSLAAVSSYRNNWRPQPGMNGFLFPDTDRERLTRQILMSKFRYNLATRSLWEGFQALTSVRPLEVRLLPGYRLFVSRSLPDFSRPGAIDYRPVNIFPTYEDSRQSSVLPSYDDLKKHYPDLDVSFLPAPPKPRLLKELADWDDDGEYPVTIGVGPYPSYFDYSTTLARRNGDVDTRPSVLHMVQNYYLGAQNWIKDMPRNFFGFQGFTYGDRTDSFIRKVQRDRIKAFSSKAERHLFAGPDTGPRLPTQLEDGTRRQQTTPRKVVEKESYGRFFNAHPYFLTKHQAFLEAYPILTLPQLSMDEWHHVFKTSLESTRRTGETVLSLDIPPITPVTYQRPNAFEGQIHVDLLASPEKQRSQALAQILLLASESRLGALNMPDYLNPRGLQAAIPSPSSGTVRRILPIVWHYPIRPLMALKTEASVLRPPAQRRVRKNVAVTWKSADAFIGRRRVEGDPLAQLFYTLTSTRASAIYENVKTRPNALTERFYEPVTVYSFLILSQFLFVPIVIQLTKWLGYFVVRDFYIELHYRVYSIPLFKEDPYVVSALRKSLRTCYHWTGQIPYEPFRIFTGIKRRFTDIVGIEPDVLCRSAEISLSLRNRGRGGPASPKGILLYGPPGNGKTFLVQAIAGEAEVPLIALTTSELLDRNKHETSVEGLVDAFKLALKMAPCVLFIDEIDGLGMKRSSMMQHQAEAPNPGAGLWPFVRTLPPRITKPFGKRGVAERVVAAAYADPIRARKELRERSIEGLLDRRRYNIDTEDDYQFEYSIFDTPEPRKAPSPVASARVALVTAFLSLMDNLRPQDGIVVIGATNRISVLDPAVRRYGRLDRHIPIYAPTEERRSELLRFFTSGLGLQESIPWDYMVDRTRAYSVSDLETMVNQSAMIAIVRGQKHTLDSLEESLEATTRHRHIRENRVPYPIVKRVPPHDPLFFVRIGYYQASRALVHNILPDHPSLPFVQLQLEPFVPEVPIPKLIHRAYTLQDLEDRLTAMLAGKAGECLLLYGSPFKTQEEINERQLLESDLGGEELTYAVDLAYAIVDQWLLIDDFTLPIRQALKLREGENKDMFFEPGGDVGRPHFILNNLQYVEKQHARLTQMQTSMFDRRDRVHNDYTHTLRWLAETKAAMNLTPEHFVKWSALFTRNPFERNMWEPVEQYYATRPHFKVIDSSASKSSSNDKLTEVKVYPTYPDLAYIDRDYLMQALMFKCFNNALELLDKHRRVVEQMADHLIHKKKLRSFEMHAYIQPYMDELRTVQPETKVRNVPNKGDVPDLRKQPDSRLQTINGRVHLVIDQSWGPESRKPGTRSIPLQAFSEPRSRDVYSDEPIPSITFDVWRKPVQERDFLKRIEDRLRTRRQNYAKGYDEVRMLYEEAFKMRMEEIERAANRREVEESLMTDLLLSMVPPLEAFIRRSGGPGQGTGMGTGF